MIPKVDNWERKNQKDAYIYSDGKNIKINIKKAIPNSSKRFSKEDLEATESLETFIIERRLFLKRIDIIAKYDDYFIEYFDRYKELPTIYLFMKDKIDSTSQSLTMNEFTTLLGAKFFRDTEIKDNIYRMVEYNYDIDVTIDKKTGRVFKGEFDFTNEEVKRILAISTFMKMVIPIVSQYIATNTLYTINELSNLTTDVFVDAFYSMGTYNGEDADELMFKLYKFTEDKIRKHKGANPLLWQQQCALRGLTESKHVDTILIKHLLSNNMFKITFDNNIIGFLKSIVETQLNCTINKVKYKKNPIRVDNTKDFNGLTGIDKLEQTMAKCDEGQIIRCHKSLDGIIRELENAEEEPISDDEISYYLHNFVLVSDFHNMLLNYHYAGLFGGYMELKNMNVTQHVKLLIIAKRQLIRDNYEELPDLLTSVSQGKMSMRLLQSAKHTNELKSAATYQDTMNNKYPALINFKDDEINSIISRVLNNTFTYVDYEDQSKTGQVIEFNSNIISNDILRFIDNI